MAWWSRAAALPASKPTRAAMTRARWSWPPAPGRPTWPASSASTCPSRPAGRRWPSTAGSLRGEEIHNPVDPDHYPEAADSDWLPQVRQALSRRYPAMHRGYGRGGYGALYGITPDWHPILDALPGIEGVYCAVGFSGHGFKMSPIVGELMSELILDGQAKTLDISSLRLARFEEKDLVKNRYAY